MAISWYCLGFFYLTNVSAYLFDNSFRSYLNFYIFWIPMAIFMSLLIDQVSRENIDFVKMFFVGSLSTLLIYTSIQPNSTISFPLTNGLYGWDWNIDFKIATFLITTLVGIMWLFYCTKIYLNAPKTMKKNAFWLLIGGILIGAIPLILFATNLMMIYLGSESVSISIGILISAIIVVRTSPIIIYFAF